MEQKQYLDFNPDKIKITRQASFRLPMNFSGVCVDAYRTGQDCDGDFIIAEFENDKGVEPIIQHESIWAGWFVENKVQAPCFTADLRLITNKNVKKPKFGVS